MQLQAGQLEGCSFQHSGNGVLFLHTGLQGTGTGRPFHLREMVVLITCLKND